MNDKVEWNYLEKVIASMRFRQDSIFLIMDYVSWTPFSFLINKAPKGHTILSRGLRQRDPLFPYLFSLCIEGLVSLLRNSTRENQVQGIKICRAAPAINHMLFANDGIIFCKADVARKIQKFLQTYGQASGLRINPKKIAMVFSKNVNARSKEELMFLRSNSTNQQYEIYLGLLLMNCKPKNGAFSEIKTRVWQKLQTLKDKLSQGERKCFWKQLPYRFPHMSWVVSSFLRNFVQI